MADQNGNTAYSLIQGLAEDPRRYDFFQALRILEAHYGHAKPRIGQSLSVADDPVRLGQPPDLAFPASTITAHVADHHADFGRLEVLFLGLFGPQGPLPSHLTEFAGERLRHFKDPTMARFADIFHHRMLSFFYRAWANAQPVANEIPSDNNPFRRWIASFYGLGLESLWAMDALPDMAKLYHAGVLSCQTHHAEGLMLMVSNVLHVPCTIREFVRHWLKIPKQEQTQLGRRPQTASLGISAILGEKTHDCQNRFRLILGPVSLETYQSLLPVGAKIRVLAAIIRNYEGGFLEWEVNLRLKHQEVPGLVLGGNQLLGWSSWLGSPPSKEWVDDLTLHQSTIDYWIKKSQTEPLGEVQ